MDGGVPYLRFRYVLRAERWPKRNAELTFFAPRGSQWRLSDGLAGCGVTSASTRMAT